MRSLPKSPAMLRTHPAAGQPVAHLYPGARLVSECGGNASAAGLMTTTSLASMDGGERELTTQRFASPQAGAFPSPG